MVGGAACGDGCAGEEEKKKKEEEGVQAGGGAGEEVEEEESNEPTNNDAFLLLCSVTKTRSRETPLSLICLFQRIWILQSLTTPGSKEHPSLFFTEIPGLLPMQIPPISASAGIADPAAVFGPLTCFVPFSSPGTVG
ncbi:hypothetical protein AAC387_Pa02g2879 [Persea americana]